MNKNSKILFVLGGIFLILAILLSTPSLIDGNVAAVDLKARNQLKPRSILRNAHKTKHSPKTPTAYPTYTYTPTTRHQYANVPTVEYTNISSNEYTHIKPTNTPTDIPSFTPTAAPSITPLKQPR